MNSLKQSSTLPLKFVNFNGITFLVTLVSFHVALSSLCDLEYRGDSPRIHRFWEAGDDLQRSIFESGQEAEFSLRETRCIARHCGTEEYLPSTASFHVIAIVFWLFCRPGSLLPSATEDDLNTFAYILSALESKKEKLTSKMGEEKLSLLPELHSRIAVLKNLQYIDEDDTVTMKGRCCCFVFLLFERMLMK